MCFECFVLAHKSQYKGQSSRATHRVEMLHAIDGGTSVTPMCVLCDKKAATRFCSACGDDRRFYCDVCFNVQHACSECSSKLGSFFCQQCKFKESSIQ